MTDPSAPITPPANPAAAPPGRRSAILKSRRSSAGTALILLALIVLPSALLGFLSWRAIEKERSYSHERLRESYQHFVRLAARQVEQHLRTVEPRWGAELDAVLASDSLPTPSRLARRAGKEPMVSGYFLISVPGHIIYPPIPLEDEGISDLWEQENHARESELFARLVAKGEELEYRTKDLDAAADAYQEILGQVSNPQLRAMAESYMGRAQLKNGDAAEALATFQSLLDRYPNMRDFNRLYLRFLAQYQIAVALQTLGRNQQALERLLELNRDLLMRSDAMNTAQYSYYTDLIQGLAPPLLSAPGISDRTGYQRKFLELREQSKKRISDKYFLQLLDAELNEAMIRRKHYTPRIQYLSASAEGEPFLIAYRALPDPQKIHTTGFVAVQIDLRQLQAELAPTIRNLRSGTESAVTIVESHDDPQAATDGLGATPIATRNLAWPYGFWQVAVYLQDVPGAMRRLDLRTTLWLWLVSLMVLSILVGAYVFILRAHREARLSRAQTTFVSRVTHELRTPLSSIKMFVELLEMQFAELRGRGESESPSTAEQHLGIIRQECDRLSRLIDRVLDFSKVEQRIRHYQFEYHDVGQVVLQIVKTFRPHAEAQGFELELSVESGLPPVRLDADAVTQVLLNLLGNAVQYSERVKQIQVCVRRDGPSVAIDVTDRGIGILPNEMGRLFDKFFTGRARPESRNLGGLGLGLSLSREIVREHGGEIRVRSKVGEGSTFTVVLPVAPASERHEAAAATLELSAPNPPGGVLIPDIDLRTEPRP